MRLGVLGPARGDLAGLARAAQSLLDDLSADKVLYVGDDDALDHVVASLARHLVGADPGDEALFSRAASRCVQATPAEIDAFVARERARLRLRVFAALPRGSRTIEILDGRVALFVYDKATLDEEDIVAAALLVYGKSDEPLVRKVGPRTFLAPGAIGCATGGAAILDDGGGGVRIDVLQAGTTTVTATERIGQPAGGRMRVQGG